MELAEREKLSLRQLYRRLAGARGTGRSSEHHAADPARVAVVELLIPELPRRGPFRTSYEGTTRREDLVLARPASRYAKRDVSAAE